ncbi:hypothetical protein H9Q10_10090 [Eikenella sp. S3360]|uniref:Toxin CptA n=1 Tax=Eikenella glucosivorans TaxID=2766967 RepID=A0ABS0NCK8_9NEIS|nr:protein YgfX [Eikenella glucosivorans]MBH5330011.1 hypothetical protein [Eikenella glucosivorans]
MQPFQVAFKPSRLRRIVHTAAWVWLAAVWLLYFAGWPCWLGLALTALAAWHALRRPLRITWLAVDSGGAAVLFLQPQQIAVAATLRGGVVLPWLQILHWHTDGGRRFHQAVWPDSADAEGLRRLRVWARWGQARPE